MNKCSNTSKCKNAYDSATTAYIAAAATNATMLISSGMLIMRCSSAYIASPTNATATAAY